MSIIMRPLIVGRSDYLRWTKEWLVDQQSRSMVVMVRGPAGIGKSTLLDAMRREAQKLNVPVRLTDGRYISTPGAWIDYMGFIMMEEMARDPVSEADDRLRLLRRLASALSSQKSILIIDNAESLGMTGEWLRTEFLPTLQKGPFLVVIAARSPLMEWVTDPFWQDRLVQWELPPLTYGDTVKYLAARQIDVNAWGAELYRKTHGHPFSLALAADVVGHDPMAVPTIPQMASMRVLHEVVTEEWMPHLEALAVVQLADQATLTTMTGREVGSLEYHGLLSLSFISADTQGLVMHDTVRRILVEDLRQRFPGRYKNLRRKALAVLGERRHREGDAMRLRTSAILLDLYRDDLPVGPWLNFSAVHGWSENNRVTARDRIALHNLLPEHPRTRLIRPQHQHGLLDALIDTHPESVRVIRNMENEPIGFWAGLWLSERTMPIVEKYLPSLLAAMGDELACYQGRPQELADTCVTIFFCYRDDPSAYTIEQVRGLVLYDSLILLGGSVRVLVTSQHPPFREVMMSIGLRPQAFRTPSGETVELLVGDKRGKGFLAFLWFLERLADSVDGLRKSQINANQIERLLKVLSNRLVFASQMRAMKFDAEPSVVMGELTRLLTDVPPTPPLKPIEQQLLRLTYLDRNLTSSAIAQSLHLSRSSYYRYRELAIQELTAVWNSRPEGGSEPLGSP